VSAAGVAHIEATRRDLGVTVPWLWVAYLTMGGDATLERLGDWLDETVVLPDRDHDLLAQALNDECIDRGGDHPVPYADTL
jgi:hypothetical protein